MTIIRQFFDKPFFLALGSLGVLFGIALIAYFFPIAPFLLIGLGVFVAALTSKEPMLGLLAVFLELFSNAHGHLISVDFFFPISLRMLFFVGFFVGFAIHLARTKQRPFLHKQGLILLTPLVVAVVFGVWQGWMLQDPRQVFQDANAYLFLLYAIPILSIHWTAKHRYLLLQMLAAGTVWNILLSFGILYVFTHTGKEIVRVIYIVLRDMRLAEMTDLGSGVYRIFLQSQFFVFPFFFLLVCLFMQSHLRTEKRFLTVLFAPIMSIILLSLSRSFWIGLMGAGIVLGGWIIQQRTPRSQWLSFFFHGGSAVLLSVLLLVAVSLFPFPPQRIDRADLTEALRTRVQSDVAVSSRWALLEPMMDRIAQHPILGSGFGAEVSFISEDPRVRESNPDGVWSTYAMEWGWLELWIKMGIFGPLAFLFYITQAIRALFDNQKPDQQWIGAGLAAGLIFLSLTHLFSPYLNHPIGLGFLLFVLAFLPQTRIVGIPATNLDSLLKMPRPASVISPQAESS